MQTFDISKYEFVRLKSLSWKYQRFVTPSGCKEIRKLEFVAKTQLFYKNNDNLQETIGKQGVFENRTFLVLVFFYLSSFDLAFLREKN